MSEENTLSRLVYIGQALANNIKHIHLHATGSDFDFIHDTAQEYYEELSDEIDDFSEIAISKGEKVDNLNNLRSNLEDDFWAEPLTDEMYDMEAFVAYMQEAGTKWIKELEDSPLEGLYKDEYLRFWKKEIEYKNEMKSIKRGGQHESDNFNKDGEIEIRDEDDDTCCNDEITSGLPPVDWKDAAEGSNLYSDPGSFRAEPEKESEDDDSDESDDDENETEEYGDEIEDDD